MTVSTTEIKQFYDDFTVSQKEMGINHRHLSIQRQLEKHGLKKGDSVLEVGCGIGTLTELMLRYLEPSANLTAVDVSEKSIAFAKERLSRYQNLTLEVFDFTQAVKESLYDVIVLPDVIEHIPLELHKQLFVNLSRMLKNSGFILIHIPDPNYLEWSKHHLKEALQIIDQPIHSHLLAQNLLGSDLYISYLKSYSVYFTRPDYQVVILRRIPTDESYQSITPKNESFFRRLKRKIEYYLRGKK